MSQKKIAIIGAGPAGIFTALLLEKFSGEVHIFEKNADIGEKLKLTGGGRMNIMNKRFSKDDFFSQLNPRKKDHFFRNPIANTPKISELFEKIGTEYFWDKNRAILQSQDAKAEVQRLKEKLLQQKNCILHLETPINRIKKKEVNNQEFFTLETKNKDIDFDKIVISTGGMFQVKEQCNKEKTYQIPEFFGHSIAKPSPSLSPFRLTKENHFLNNASGIALPVKIFSGKFLAKKKKYEKEISDDLLITHFGFSGPAVLDFSAIWDGKEEVFINFLPKLSPQLFGEIFTTARKGKHSVHRFLHTYFSKKFIENLFSHPDFSEKMKNLLTGKEAIHIADISKQDEQLISSLIFSYPVRHPEKFPYQGCWTTKGGVDIQNVEMSTLESKLQKNLYFAGEILDIDGLCGGYHISFAMVCASIISQKILKNTL